MQINAVIAQGGGPTAVINQSLIGVILKIRESEKIDTLYGAIHGISGIIEEQFINLNNEKLKTLEKVAQTPAAGLLSTRDKPDPKYCERIVNIFKQMNVRYFFYIGGNDSADTLRLLNEYTSTINYDLTCIHIPKTIDNDLVINDHTPGYGSAAKFIAQAFIGINYDNASLTGVYLGILMGRHAGFLTAASAISSKITSGGPHLIYMPERAFVLDDFLRDIEQAYKKNDRCIVAISEGIQNKDGRPVAETLIDMPEFDPHGNMQLDNGDLGSMLSNAIKKDLGVKRIRTDRFGYLQRSFPGCISSVDSREARAVGEKAVEFALKPGRSGSVTIHRVGNYKVKYMLSKLEDIGGKTKSMPDEFINSSGNGVTEKFIDYVMPLIGEAVPDTAVLDGLNILKHDITTS